MRALLPVLLLLGCAFNDAMTRGDRAAEAGAWREALQAYQQAKRIEPESPEAATAIERMRARIGQDAFERAEEALRQRHWPQAVEHLRTVEASEAGLPGAAGLGRRLAEAIAADARLDEAAARYEAAHSKAALAHGLVPQPALLASLAKGATERAEAAEAAEDFATAAQALARVGRHQRSAEFSARAKAVEQRWAKWARGKAQGAEAGEAWLHHRLALALGHPDRAALAKLEARLLARAPAVTVAVDAEPARGTRWRALERGGGAAGPSLKVRVALAPTDCAQRKKTHAGAHRYLAGKKQARNPEWARQRERVAQAEDALAREADGQLRATEALMRAEAKGREALRRHRDRWGRTRTDRRKTLDRRLEAERRSFQEWQRVGQRARGGEASAQRQLERCDRDWSAARQAVERARDKLAETNTRARRAREQLERGEDEVLRLREAWLRREREVARRRAELREAARNQDAVPPLIEVDRYETWRYPIHQHTLTCTARVRAVLQLGAAHTHDLKVSDAVTDQQHAASVRHGLSEDPLRWPLDRAGLASHVEAKAAKQLEGLISRRLQAWRVELAGRGSDGLALAWLLDPARVSKAQRQRLRARFGMDVLRAGR